MQCCLPVTHVLLCLKFSREKSRNPDTTKRGEPADRIANVPHLTVSGFRKHSKTWDAVCRLPTFCNVWISRFFSCGFQTQQNAGNRQTALQLSHVLQCLDFANTVIAEEFTLPREPNTIIPGEFTQRGCQMRQVPRNSHRAHRNFNYFKQKSRNQILEIKNLFF